MKYKKEVFDGLYESSFVPKPKVGAALDLHMSLVHPGLFAIEQKALWRDSVVHPSFNDANVSMLSAEHALIHQEIHAFNDMNFFKYNLLDSHGIINSLNPDLTLTVKIAKSWDVSVACYYLLQNCTDIMGNKVDEQLLSYVKPSQFRPYMAGKLLAYTFAQPAGTTKPMRYRLNQVLSQFVFTGSFLITLKLHWLFITSAIQKRVHYSAREVSSYLL
jgi:hypothetical protein